jgi:hypothetical protein
MHDLFDKRFVCTGQKATLADGACFFQIAPKLAAFGKTLT